MAAQLLADLKAVRALLAEPTVWCGPHRECDILGQSRCLACLIWDGAKGGFGSAYRAVSKTLRGDELSLWERDSRRTHSDVITLLDTTIARIEKEAGNVD